MNPSYGRSSLAGDAPERRERVLEALVEAGEAGVSGETLAGRLGCSRAAVHRHVEALRRAGIAVEGAHGGYRLAADVDPVVPIRVAERLDGPISGPVEWLADTGSTNDDVTARARAGAPEGLVIGADHQGAGRGRRGRVWVAAPHDAVLMSVLLRPRVAPVDAGLLPIVAAVGVAEGLGEAARIVWPNDILIDRRKVSGILCEMSADQEHVAWAVVGIGINVRGAPVLGDARWRAGSLAEAGLTGSRTDVIASVLTSLGRRYREWLDEGPQGILAAFAARDALRGLRLVVASGDSFIAGAYEGLDELGRLRIREGDRVRALAAGEVARVEEISAG